MRAAGRPVISLSAGEPDFPTPEAIAEAGRVAITEGWTRYTQARGDGRVLAAVSDHLERSFGLRYRTEEICITAGTKPAIYLGLLSLLEPGDEVVVFAPYWVSYPDIVRLAGGVPRIHPCTEDRGFLPDPEELESLCSDTKVRGLILNTPNNPTGAVWPPALVETLVRVCERHDLWILSDEIYAQILFGDTVHVSPAEVARGRERVLVLNGLSKAFAMTGWRIGYMAGPREQIEAVAKIQSQLLGNPCTISQGAALVAVDEECERDRIAMLREYDERRRFLCEELPSIPGLSFHPPRGAFYTFPGVREICGKSGMTDETLADRLLEECEVATVPGAAFGMPGHLRLSFAASLADLKEALSRMRKWLGGLLQ